jgi:FkbM family methyltransferase
MNKEEIRLFNRFIEMQEALKPTISIEVGAYKAEFSKTMIGKVNTIYAFEASPFVYNNFKNEIPKEINYINKTISNTSGAGTFKMRNDTNPAKEVRNSILAPHEAYNILYSELGVETTTLDEYFKDTEENICLWVDVEGANKEVLLGASKLLEKVSSIHIEIENHHFWQDQWLYNDVINYLAGYGFKELDFADILPYRKQSNVIFTK